MIKLLEDNTVICGDGSNVNSHHPDKTSCSKGSLIAKAFTYRHDINYTRTDEHIEDLSFNDSTVTVSCHDCTITGQEGNIKLIDRANHDSRTIDPLQGYSTESDRVKTFCGIVFDAEVKAAYIARLPTVDVKVAGKTTTETVKVPAVTEKQVVDGVLTDVVIEEAREEEREVQATQAFIQYKGELYASARDLL